MRFHLQVCSVITLFILLAILALTACGGGGVGKTVYVIGLGTPQVAQLSVQSTGVLKTTPNVATVGSNPTSIVIEPRRRFAYVADSNGANNGTATNGAVSQLSITRSTGLLSPITLTNAVTVGQTVVPQPVGINPVALATDASGNFLFVANKGSNTISVFSIVSDGTLSEVKGSPFATATAPVGLAVHGNTLYVASQTAAVVSSYTFDQTSGALTAVGSPVAAGTHPTAIAIDPSGKFLYVTDGTANTVTLFTAGSGGSLSAGASTAAGTNPVSVNVSPTGHLLFVANQGSNNVSVYMIDSGSGALSSAGSPSNSGTGPDYVWSDSSGSFLFVANGGSNDISVFMINGSSGALTAVSGSPFSNSGVGQPDGIITLD